MTVNKPNGRMAYGSGGSHPPLNRCERSLSQRYPLPPPPPRVSYGGPAEIFSSFSSSFFKRSSK